MKMQITVNIKNEDNTEVAEPTIIEVDVPEFEAFTGPDKFGEVFDEYERKVLKARNEAIEAARRSADKKNRVLWRQERADQVS